MKKVLIVAVLALVCVASAQARITGWVRYTAPKHVKHVKHHRSHWLAHLSHRFIANAMCVHDGWHHAPRPPLYPRTWNVPDNIAGGTGEATWHDDGWPYYNGFQFAPSTWRRAGGHPSRLVSASPAEQIYRVWVIVMRQDHGSWGEWPNTARACGLR